jgi:hypothetical protein
LVIRGAHTPHAANSGEPPTQYFSLLTVYAVCSGEKLPADTNVPSGIDFNAKTSRRIHLM